MTTPKVGIPKIASWIRDYKVIASAILLILVGVGVDVTLLGLHITKWMIKSLTQRIIPINPLSLLVLLIVLGAFYFLLNKIKILSKKDKYELCYFPNTKVFVKKLINPKTKLEKDMYFCPTCITNREPPLLQFEDEAIEDWYICPNFDNCKFIIKTPKK